MSTFAINGFGRIGRLVMRSWYEHHRKDISLAAINTSGSLDLQGWAYLLKYDTTYGMFPGVIGIEEHQTKAQVTDSDPLLGYLLLDLNLKIPVFAQRNPSKIPWGSVGAGTVLECTGIFLSVNLASQHYLGGAKAVLLAAPGKDASIPLIVKGVTEPAGQGNLYSNASCTTNCIAPIMVILQEAFGIQKAMLNTTHSYTDDQNLQDGSSHDFRRGRAAAVNIVPTTTGAAQAAAKVVPGLTGLFDGLAIRVPSLTGSLADITALLGRSVTRAEVNEAIILASENPRWNGIVATTSEPLVSSDIIGRTESAIVDLSLTQVVGDNLVKVVAWYDNEWGFSNRLLEMAIAINHSLGGPDQNRTGS